MTSEKNFFTAQCFSYYTKKLLLVTYFFFRRRKCINLKREKNEMVYLSKIRNMARRFYGFKLLLKFYQILSLVLLLLIPILGQKRWTYGCSFVFGKKKNILKSHNWVIVYLFYTTWKMVNKFSKVLFPLINSH